ALALGINFPVVDRIAALNKITGGTGAPQPNTAIDPNFRNPYSIQWNVTVERQLTSGMVLEVGYIGNRGVHLNMVRMENLPDRLTGISPMPSWGSFRYYDGSDSSNYNALQI